MANAPSIIPREELASGPIVVEKGPYTISDTGDFDSSATNGTGLIVFTAPHDMRVHYVDISIDADGSTISESNSLIADLYKLKTTEDLGDVEIASPTATKLASTLTMETAGLGSFDLTTSTAGRSANFLQKGERVAVVFDEGGTGLVAADVTITMTGHSVVG